MDTHIQPFSLIGCQGCENFPSVRHSQLGTDEVHGQLHEPDAGRILSAVSERLFAQFGQDEVHGRGGLAQPTPLINVGLGILLEDIITV